MIDGPAKRPSWSQASAVFRTALHQRADERRVACRIAGELQTFVAFDTRQRDGRRRGNGARAAPARPRRCGSRCARLARRSRPARAAGATSAWLPASASISASCASESTRKWNSRSGCSSRQSDDFARSRASPTSWLAMITRRTPKRTQTPSCCTLATVMPQAPAASCCAKICGAIVVLPCGASSTPVAAVKSRIHAWLWASADSRSTARGNGRSPRRQVPALRADRRQRQRCGAWRKSLRPRVDDLAPQRIEFQRHGWRGGHSDFRSLGSSRSRRPSPTIWSEIAASMIAMPGKITTHSA